MNRPVVNVVLELRRCPHETPQRLAIADGILLRCLACGAVHLGGEWHQPLLVDELGRAIDYEKRIGEREPRAMLGDELGRLEDVCRCGHDRGEHMGKPPFECDMAAHLGSPTDEAVTVYPCGCRGFELEPKALPGVVDAVWEEKTPAMVVRLADYRGRS